MCLCNGDYECMKSSATEHALPTDSFSALAGNTQTVTFACVSRRLESRQVYLHRPPNEEGDSTEERSKSIDANKITEKQCINIEELEVNFHEGIIIESEGKNSEVHESTRFTEHESEINEEIDIKHIEYNSKSFEQEVQISEDHLLRAGVPTSRF